MDALVVPTHGSLKDIIDAVGVIVGRVFNRFSIFVQCQTGL